VQILLSKTLLPLLMRALYATLKKNIQGERAASENAIVAFWHGKMTVGWLLAKRLSRPKKCYAVVSLSKDGSYLANALSSMNFGLIRGSSSRGKEAVKREMIDALRKGEIIAITPDGPRGAREVFKYGTIRIAAETDSPILFADIKFENAWRLEKSWDKFEIPKPFSRVHITVYEIRAPKFETENDLKDFTNALTEQFRTN
jgi:lysophospholipid acyltransferase (LPLAT)-like uncharacterized protein